MNSTIESLRIIERVEDLAPLESDWWRLWELTPIQTPFNSPAWVLAHLRNFGSANLRILCTYADGTLIGILPLQHNSIAGEGISDYLDGCYQIEAAPLLCQGPAELRHLHANSPLRRDSQEQDEICLVLELRQFTPLENVEYAKRRLARDYSVHFLTSDESDVAEHLARFFELHRKRWTDRGQHGVLTDPTVQSFHHEVALDFARRGILRLHTLLLNNTPVAAFYGFKCRDTTFFYLSGFDPEFEKRSVGAVILDHAVRHAIDENCASFDFLRGQESYKYKWGARDTFTYRRSITR